MQQELRYVYQVYLDGSISRAAEHLFITQPALSLAIQKIEKNLGMPLFDRSTRPLTLTPAGRACVETARQMMFLEQDLNRQIEDIRSLSSGSLCIGGSHYLNAFILPRVLTGFSRRYPGIRLELVEASAAELAGMLSERELDLTFSCDPEFMLGFQRFPAFHDRVLLAVPESDPVNASMAGAALTAADVLRGAHLEETCPAADLKQFQCLEFILLTPGNNLHDRGLQLFEEAGIQPKIRMEVSQLVTAFQLAENAMAAAFISDRLITSGDSRLRFYRLNSSLADRQFCMLLPESRYTPAAVRAFVQYFSDTVPNP